MPKAKLEALIGELESEQILAGHLARDFASTQEDVVCVLYFQFGLPINKQEEQNLPILSALSQDYLLSKACLNEGKSFLGLYLAEDNHLVHKDADKRAMQIRTQLLDSKAPLLASTSFIANSGNLSEVYAHAEKMCEKSKEQKTHYHDFQS